MGFVVWAPVFFQLVVPTGMLAWLAFGRHRSRTTWLLTAVLLACYLIAVAVAGLWLIVPWFTPLVYAVLFLLAVIPSMRNARALPAWPRGRRSWAGAAILGSLTALAAGVVIYALSGWRSPGMAVELLFPLRGGTYLVVNGGGNALINAHVATLHGKQYLPWRGQSYGVDLVKLNHSGLRSSGLLPGDPAAYVIFGEPLYAPCGGEVMAALDGAPEMPPPRMDRQNMAGNHVILSCGSAWVLLGHMQKGSVQVRPGEKVTVGQPLGRVGNTGNSGEPHLHIHAQLPGTVEAPLSGDPLPIRLGHRYPVRNARFRAQSAGQQ